jgi:Lon protease-like protein
MHEGRFEMPLFPLHTVLFPGGLLPLKVFEQRYVEMTKKCVRDGSVFGVCAIREGREVGDPAVPASVGCTARISQWDVPFPNLFHIIANGEQRFRVLRTEVAPLGLLVCEAEYLPAEPAHEAPDALCRGVLEKLVERFGAEQFPSPLRYDDAAWVSYRLAEVLPLSMAARQQLLETDDARARLEILRTVLGNADLT